LKQRPPPDRAAKTIDSPSLDEWLNGEREQEQFVFRYRAAIVAAASSMIDPAKREEAFAPL